MQNIISERLNEYILSGGIDDRILEICRRMAGDMITTYKPDIRINVRPDLVSLAI